MFGVTVRSNYTPVRCATVIFKACRLLPVIFSVVIKCSLTSLFLEDPYLVSMLLR